MTEPANKESLKRLLRQEISNLGLPLSDSQLEQLGIHFALLLQWNRKMNLVSSQDPGEIASRHFGESLFLAKILEPEEEWSNGGVIVDVGSGAGFPGLPLKVAWPGLELVMLEPNQKKTAFLKEVVRSCGMKTADARAQRLEEAVLGSLQGIPNLVTMRAVAPTSELMNDLKKLLKPGGRAALFVGAQSAAEIVNMAGFQWSSPLPTPHSERRVILLGRAERR